MTLNLSQLEEDNIFHSKSMTIRPTPDIDTKLIKQIGDYKLGAEVGCGAFGKVVMGKHIQTGEKVAIKILDKMILDQTPEDYELVKKEMSILRIVKHKYIVQLYEILETPQHIFMIMEYCEGKEILDYILTKTYLSELESLKYFQQLINALFYLHSQNIAHRDVKIDNMLLDKNRDLKLIDFGLSTQYPDDSLLSQPCGTVVYAAPEVLDGKDYHGMLVDVWSSGIVLYGMLGGYLPFSDKNDEVNKKLIISGKYVMPDFFSDLAKDLLYHMLDINPMTRYTLQEIKEHPWFNLTDYSLIPGIIIGYNIVPIDENIVNICVNEYNVDKEKVIDSVQNNLHNSYSALYYLLIKKLKRLHENFTSVSDLSSGEFIDYILDKKNLVNPDAEEENSDIEEEIPEKEKQNQDVKNMRICDMVITNSSYSSNEHKNRSFEIALNKNRLIEDSENENTYRNKDIVLLTQSSKENETDIKNNKINSDGKIIDDLKYKIDDNKYPNLEKVNLYNFDDLKEENVIKEDEDDIIFENLSKYGENIINEFESDKKKQFINLDNNIDNNINNNIDNNICNNIDNNNDKDIDNNIDNKIGEEKKSLTEQIDLKNIEIEKKEKEVKPEIEKIETKKIENENIKGLKINNEIENKEKINENNNENIIEEKMKEKYNEIKAEEVKKDFSIEGIILQNESNEKEKEKEDNLDEKKNIEAEINEQQKIEGKIIKAEENLKKIEDINNEMKVEEKAEKQKVEKGENANEIKNKEKEKIEIKGIKEKKEEIEKLENVEKMKNIENKEVEKIEKELVLQKDEKPEQNKIIKTTENNKENKENKENINYQEKIKNKENKNYKGKKTIHLTIKNPSESIKQLDNITLKTVTSINEYQVKQNIHNERINTEGNIISNTENNSTSPNINKISQVIHPKEGININININIIPDNTKNTKSNSKKNPFISKAIKDLCKNKSIYSIEKTSEVLNSLKISQYKANKKSKQRVSTKKSNNFTESKNTRNKNNLIYSTHKKESSNRIKKTNSKLKVVTSPNNLTKSHAVKKNENNKNKNKSKLLTQTTNKTTFTKIKNIRSSNKYSQSITKTNLNSKFLEAQDSNKNNNVLSPLHTNKHNDTQLTNMKKKNNSKNTIFSKTIYTYNKNKTETKFYPRNKKASKPLSPIGNNSNNNNNSNTNLLSTVKKLDYEHQNNKLSKPKNNKNTNQFNKSLTSVIFSRKNKFYEKQNQKYTINKKNKINIDIDIDSPLWKENKNKNEIVHQIESSVKLKRLKNHFEIRNISESPNNKFMSIRERNTRIPWKIKKKGIDQKLCDEIIYEKYMKKLNKNPFAINNTRVVNTSGNTNKTNLVTNLKQINLKIKNRYQKISKLHKNYSKNKYKPFSQKNIFNKKNDTNENIDSHLLEKEHNKKLRAGNVNSLTALHFNSSAEKKSLIDNKFEKHNNNLNTPFDLSCINIYKGKNINYCINNLIEKLKKKGIYFTQRKNTFKCVKANIKCEIEIIKLDNNLKDDNNNIFVYKIINRRGVVHNIGDVFKKIIINNA